MWDISVSSAQYCYEVKTAPKIKSLEKNQETIKQYKKKKKQNGHNPNIHSGWILKAWQIHTWPVTADLYYQYENIFKKIGKKKVNIIGV